MIAQLDITDAAGKLSESGIVAILLFLLLMFITGVGTTVWFILRRLFRDGGVIPRLTDAHMKFLEKLEDAVHELSTSVKESTTVATKVDSTVKKLQAAIAVTNVSLAHFRRVWRHHIKLLEISAKAAGVQEEAHPHLTAIERLLDFDGKDEKDEKDDA